jgi:hypothetical protein
LYKKRVESSKHGRVAPRTAIERNWIPAFAGMTDEEKINRGFRALLSEDIFFPLSGRERSPR